MPYTTATPIKINGDEVTVEFTGPGVPRHEAVTSQRPIEVWAISVLNQLNTPRSRAAAIVVGTALDLTPVPAPPLTARQVYERDRAAVLKDEEDLRNRVTTAANPKLAANLAAAQASRAAYDAEA